MASQGFNNEGFNVYTGAPEALAFNINTAGNITQAKQLSFLATINAETNTTGDGTVAAIGAGTATTIVFQRGTAFAAGNGAGTGATLTAPVTGIYQLFLTANIFITPTTGGTAFELEFATTGSVANQYTIGDLPTRNRATGFFGTGAANNEIITVGGTVILPLAAADTVTFTLTSFGGAKVDSVKGGFICGILLA